MSMFPFYNLSKHQKTKGIASQLRKNMFKVSIKGASQTSPAVSIVPLSFTLNKYMLGTLWFIPVDI